MWSFVSSIPEASLASWYRGLTVLAIGFPVIGATTGGLCGWFAFSVSDRINALQSTTIIQQNGQISHLTGDLQTVREQADQLAIKAQNAERSVSDTYDFNGAHRRNMGAGRTTLMIGQEAAVFQNIMKLNNEKDWMKLKSTCEEQIKKTPSWFTPYLFSGIASANLGDINEAERRLELVVNGTGSDPSYSDASRILSEIKLARH